MPTEEPQEPAVQAPRRVRAKAEPRTGWSRLRRVLFVLALMALLLGAVAVVYQADQFLASNPRFHLAGSPESHPGLVVHGRHFTPEPELAAVFAGDFGRSVYLMPLAERRRALLRIDWIKEATVARRWPNTIDVAITERVPVAFAMLPRGAAAPASPAGYDTALVDEEGVVLHPPARAQFDLPVLYGLSFQQALEGRRNRVRHTLELIRQVKEYAGQIAEINAADPDNLTITYTVQGGTVRLILGNQSYRERLQGFLSRYADINRRLPNLHTFDIRLYPHIIAPGGIPNAY